MNRDSAPQAARFAAEGAELLCCLLNEALEGAALVLPSTGCKIWRQQCRKPISRKPKPSRFCQDLRSRSFIAAHRQGMPSSFRLICSLSHPSRRLDDTWKRQIHFYFGCVLQRRHGLLGSGLFLSCRRTAPSAGFPRGTNCRPFVIFRLLDEYARAIP